MEDMTVPGVNEGKPISIEQMNLEAVEVVGMIKDLAKEDRVKTVRYFVMAALISSNSLVVQPTDPKYRATIELWARRMPADKAMMLAEKFKEVNTDFFDRGAEMVKRIGKLPPSNTSSAPSSQATPSSTPRA